MLSSSPIRKAIEKRKTMSNVILSIVGILVSLVGLCVAIWQVWKLKKTTENYQKQVKLEVSQAQKQIRNGLYISGVTLCIKNLESAINFIREGKTELALLRMEDMESIIHNSRLSEKYLDKEQTQRFKEAIDDYKDSLRSLIKNNDGKNLEKEFILDSLSTIREYLSIIDNSLKESLYGERS